MDFYKIRRSTLIILVKSLAKLMGFNLPATCAAAAIITRNGKILVVELTYRNGLALPGGGVTRGETLEAALSREVTEETGLHVNKLEYFGSFSNESGELESMTAVFIAKTLPGKLISSEEGRPFWIDPADALPRLVYPDNVKALKAYLK